jgi:hypothetical protein
MPRVKIGPALPDYKAEIAQLKDPTGQEPGQR